jgi:hypothetical protein
MENKESVLSLFFLYSVRFHAAFTQVLYPESVQALGMPYPPAYYGKVGHTLRSTYLCIHFLRPGSREKEMS